MRIPVRIAAFKNLLCCGVMEENYKTAGGVAIEKTSRRTVVNLTARDSLREFSFGNTLPAVKSKGTVYLVGAGPGDAGLLTLRGAELLARADVLVYDALVNKDLLRLAPRTVEIIYAGKRSKDHAIPQDELN